MGMVIAALGFLILTIGSFGLMSPAEVKAAGASDTFVSQNWLISTYLVLTFAELLLSPMGISFVSKVAPPKYKGYDDGLLVRRNGRGQLRHLAHRIPLGQRNGSLDGLERADRPLPALGTLHLLDHEEARERHGRLIRSPAAQISPKKTPPLQDVAAEVFFAGYAERFLPACEKHPYNSVFAYIFYIFVYSSVIIMTAKEHIAQRAPADVLRPRVQGGAHG